MKKAYQIGVLLLILIIAGFFGVYTFIKKDSQQIPSPYVGLGDECRTINYICSPGTTEFYDGVGCGCKAAAAEPITASSTNQTYMGRGVECKYIDYECETGKKHYDDGIGCGCM